MSKKAQPAASKVSVATRAVGATGLLTELRELIEQARRTAVAAVNASLTLMYWRVGQRIGGEVLGGQRAGYGDEIVATLSRQLVADYGRGFEEKNLRRMVQFAALFASEEIVVTLSRQLSWSHFLALLPVKDPLARDFYAQMCRLEQWSVRSLRARVESMLFERTALAAKPDELIRQELAALRAEGDLSPPLLLKDPYVLDFLALGGCRAWGGESENRPQPGQLVPDLQPHSSAMGQKDGAEWTAAVGSQPPDPKSDSLLDDRYLEKGLEDAILRELEQFLLELGAGFSFVARQRRIQLDSDDFYIDLLFYNRKLRRLVALELKLGDFKAEYKGQMELYLRWLAKHDQEPGDLPPLGIILCTGKKHEQIELLELSKSGIHVAEYLTVLPPRAQFEQKIQTALAQARQRLAQQDTDEA